MTKALSKDAVAICVPPNWLLTYCQSLALTAQSAVVLYFYILKSYNKPFSMNGWRLYQVSTQIETSGSQLGVDKSALTQSYDRAEEMSIHAGDEFGVFFLARVERAIS